MPLLTLAMAMQDVADRSPPHERDIVVTAHGAGPDAATRRFVDALSATLPPDRPIARFHDPICVQSLGLPPAADRAIEVHVRGVGRDIGVPVAGAGCVPNITVMFVADARTAFDRLSRSARLSTQSLADVRRIRTEPGTTRVWIDTETRSRDGDRPTYNHDVPPILATAMSSRLSLPIRRDIVSAVLLIDRHRVANRPLTQVADHVAFRALAGVSSVPPLAGCSILSLFDGRGDRADPPGMTAIDRGYLRALYSGRSDLKPAMKRGTIIDHILAETGTGGADDDCGTISPQ